MRTKTTLTLFAGLVLSGALYASEPQRTDMTQVPADETEFFLERYGYFVPKKERKPLEEIYKQINKIDDAYKNELKKFDKQLKDADEKYKKALKQLIEQKRPETEVAALTAEYAAGRETVRAQRQVVIDKRDAEKLPFRSQLEPLIAQFWTARDPNPATPENEFKNLIDERIQDIAEERFFTVADTTGLKFAANGGFRGDMAKVYLLHGLPDATGSIERHTLFVDLMLWLYVDERGEPKYAFLFYERGDAGGYQLFYQDQFQMDPCGAINEVLKFRNLNYTRGGNGQCPTEVQRAYQQLQMGLTTRGDLQGYHFAWALLNFSRDPSVRVGTALEPPISAMDSAAKSGARVAGEAPKLEPVEGTEYLMSGCQYCKSSIPAELQLGSGQTVMITFRPEDIDWQVQGDDVSYSLEARLVFENGPDVRVFEKTFVVHSQKAYVTKPSGDRLAQRLLEDEEVAALPSGTYRVGVYVRNTLTNKYAAWEQIFVKP